jgi:hypothetical protein
MLILHFSGREPLGNFDGYVGETLLFKGGEVCSWAGMVYPTAGAADVNNDGYVGYSAGKQVPGISKAWGTNIPTVVPPCFLADDGTTGYGTLFGSVVGGAVGSVVTGGAVLGPHTATGSGKVTVWDKPGVYGVTLDAVDTTASTGLVPGNTSLRVGAALGFTSAGLLTPITGGTPVSPGFIVGRLASFENTGSLVTTPSSLTMALNSPSGSVSSVVAQKMTQVVFYFNGADANSTS